MFQPTLYGAIITAIDCGIFSKMGEDPDSPISVIQLSEATQTDPALLSLLIFPKKCGTSHLTLFQVEY